MGGKEPRYGRGMMAQAFTAIIAITVIAALGTTGSIAAVPVAAAARAPVKVGWSAVKTGLKDPAAFDIAPNGLIFYGQRSTGKIRILDPSTGKERLFYRLKGVQKGGERGILGLALHPRWPKRAFVFVYATQSRGGNLVNQVTRIKAKKLKGLRPRVIMRSDASTSSYHNGGHIQFGPDRKLYVVVGDGHQASTSQNLGDLRGKVLRMTASGKPARDNPFGKSRVWAYGIRNSFGFDFDPITRRLWLTDNGPGCNDEINLIRRKGNYAWGPNQNCNKGKAPANTNRDGPKPRRKPQIWYGSTIGITGLAFCHDCGLGAIREDNMFFGDVNTGKLRRVVLNQARNKPASPPTNVFKAPGGAIYSIQAAPDGTLYFSNSKGIYRIVAKQP